MKYIYSTSQMSKLSLTLHTFSITGSVAGLFLTSCSNRYFVISYLKNQLKLVLICVPMLRLLTFLMSHYFLVLSF